MTWVASPASVVRSCSARSSPHARPAGRSRRSSPRSRSTLSAGTRVGPDPDPFVRLPDRAGGPVPAIRPDDPALRRSDRATGGRPEGGAAMFVPGQDLAVESDFYGTANLAQRVDREVSLMDQRGTGRSLPSLDCPEIEALSADALRDGIERRAPKPHSRRRVSLSGTTDREGSTSPRTTCRPWPRTEWTCAARWVSIPGASRRTDRVARRVGDASGGSRPTSTCHGPRFPRVPPGRSAHHGRHGDDERSRPSSTTARAGTMCEAAYPGCSRALQAGNGRLDDHPMTVSTRTPSGQPLRCSGRWLGSASRPPAAPRGQTDASYAPSLRRLCGRHGDVSSVIAPHLALSPAFCAGYLPSCDESSRRLGGDLPLGHVPRVRLERRTRRSVWTHFGRRGLSHEVFANNPWVEAALLGRSDRPIHLWRNR